MTAARLMLAGGSGRLVRRPSIVLFDPTGRNPDLAVRFDEAASDSEALNGVKKHLIDSGFTAAPLVIVSWDRAQLDLLLFGDVAIHTSAMAASMVSGAGSASWVERNIGEIERGGESTVDLWSGDAADPSTNLGLGVVVSAGFRLSLEFSSADAAERRDDDAQPDPLSAPAPAVADAPVPAEAPSSLAAALVPPASAASAVLPASAAPPAPALHVSEVTDHSAIARDPHEAEAADESAVSGSGPAPAEEDPIANDSDADISDANSSASVDDDADTGPGPEQAVDSVDDGGEAADDPFTASASEGPRVGLIEAAHCQQGHPNPPRSAACYRCGISLIDDQSLSLIDQPAVGRIVFPGGQSVVLDRHLELGRKPAPPQSVHPVIIDHAEVSRSHASLKVEGWTVLLTDMDSRNGTWIVPPNDVTPVRLDPDVSHVLEHGTRVHVGGPEVAFTYLFDAEEQ